MTDKINELLRRVEEFNPKAAAEIEEFRIKILGKKGELNALMEDFKTVAPELKRELGQQLNKLKTTALDRINSLREQLQDAASDDGAATEDMTRPGSAEQLGSRHPISLVKNQIVEVFSRLGYTVADGPEIEDDWHVFSALNFPPEHPARDMQDTFYINDRVVLRTHTSPCEARALMNLKPPFRLVMPGRVFRVDEVDASHSPVFMQMEGFVVDHDITLADLKGTLDTFVHAVFGEDVRTRFRPSYFPFTEPSAEVDISCSICGGKGCRVCKGTGWIEILGCGVTNPHELENCGLDPREWKAIAFGIGVDRVTSLKYGITDIRLEYENDARFLRQF